MPHNNKNELLLRLLNRINTAVKTASPGVPPGEQKGCCQACPYRVDPMLNRTEAWAYTGFKPGTLAVWDCNKTYDLQPIKFGNAVRYRLSSLNRFADERLKPE